MIADRRSEELSKWSGDERSPFGLAVPGVSGAAPTTTPERLSESHGLRCLIAANFCGRDQSFCPTSLSLSLGKAADKLKLCEPLRWPLADVHGRHAASQILKSDVRKTLCAHHRGEPRLIRKA